MKGFTEAHMQVAMARYFDSRRNIVVPNISWGMQLHECDVLVLTPAGFAYEVEIKVNRADIVADGKKAHGHYDKKLVKLFYAVPKFLADFALTKIPERAGLLAVESPTWLWAQQIRAAKQTGDYRWTAEQRLKLAHLGCMRIWPLLENLNRSDDALLFDDDPPRRASGSSR
jgi:hypothetical protein